MSKEVPQSVKLAVPATRTAADIQPFHAPLGRDRAELRSFVESMRGSPASTRPAPRENASYTTYEFK